MRLARGLIAAVLTAALAAGVLLSGTPAHARRVRGTITEDTTWTASANPVVLIGRVVVAPSATLTIEPGVRVEGSPASELVVRGVLRAQGSILDPIVFTSRSGARDWYGVTFVGTAGLQGTDTRSVLSFGLIERAEVGVRAIFDSPSIHDMVFQRNGIGLHVVMPAANMTIARSQFLRNRTAVAGHTASDVTIELSDFWNNHRSIVAGPKRWFDCVPDDGAWLVRFNDILRGPRQGWFAWDVRSTPGSMDSTYTVDARFNYWGTRDERDVRARIYDGAGPGAGGQHKPFLWDPFLPVPVTPWQPPGPVASPDQEAQSHGDPPTIAWVDWPIHGGCFSHGELDTIRGRAQPWGGKLRWVKVAIGREDGAECRWLVGLEPRFSKARSCQDPVWFTPDGSERWSVRTKAPYPLGRYRVIAATTDWELTADFQELGRNYARFRVTR